MSARAYYNEFDPYAAQWLRNLIDQNLIAPGDVDERSITDVSADDLKGYTQCHFFAGIGGWSFAARLAGWPDDRELWTGSCPCQPYSLAGKGLGQKDPRDLWPIWFDLIAAVRPSAVMGEQVKDAIGKHWLDRMRVDLEGSGYALGATVLPACSVDAPHRRDRLWFVADASGGRRGEQGEGQNQQSGRAEILGAGDGAVCPACGGRGRMGPFFPGGRSTICGNCTVANSASIGSGAGLRQGDQIENGHGVASSGSAFALGNAIGSGLEGQRGDGNDRNEPGRDHADPSGSAAPASSLRLRNSTAWSGAEWIAGADGKARRFEPSIRLLAHGVPARVGKLRAYGNAIVPQVAAEVIAAYMEAAA